MNFLPQAGQTEASNLLLFISALLLAQGLIRDLWILYRARTAPTTKAARVRCFCVESAVGGTGVLAGALLFSTGASYPISLDARAWVFIVVATLALGYAIRDYVFEWNPLRIKKDVDHINIIVTFIG
jgi:hypothetical protein